MIKKDDRRTWKPEGWEGHFHRYTDPKFIEFFNLGADAMAKAMLTMLENEGIMERYFNRDEDYMWWAAIRLEVLGEVKE